MQFLLFLLLLLLLLLTPDATNVHVEVKGFCSYAERKTNGVNREMAETLKDTLSQHLLSLGSAKKPRSDSLSGKIQKKTPWRKTRLR